MTTTAAAQADSTPTPATQILRERYRAVFRAMLVLAMLSYGSYLALFVALGVPTMPLVNAVAAALCFFAWWAAGRGHLRVASFITALVVLGHTGPATAVLGWRASFHLFAFVVLVFFLLDPERRLLWKVAIASAVTTGYVFLEGRSQEWVTVVPDGTLTLFRILNILMFSGTLSYLALIYSRSIWQATSSLSELNGQLVRAERNLRELFQLSPVAMVLSRVADQRLLDGNVHAQTLFDIPIEDARGKPAYDFWVRAEERARMQAAMRTSGRVERFEAELRTRAGRVFWAELSAGLLEFQGEPALLVAATDITERRRGEALLRESEMTLRAILDAAPMPLVVTGLEDGIIRYSNQRAGELFELSIDKLVGKRAPDFYVRADDRVAFIEELRREGMVFAFTARLRSSSGREQWMLLSAKTIELNGEKLFMVGFANVGEHKALEEQLRQLATTDGLTGAFNRRHFFELGETELKRATRSGHATAVAMIDADFFKKINDELGHDSGDAALRMIIEVIRSGVRTSDVVARLGGEEFALLMPETSLEAAAGLAERIRVAIEAHTFIAQGTARHVTVSVGVAAAEPDEKLEAVLRRADAALYDAKKGGRNRVAIRAAES